MREDGLYDMVIQYNLVDKVNKIIKYIGNSNRPYLLVAKKYRTKSSFQRKDGHMYWLAEQKGIIDEICAHMPEPKGGFNSNIPGILYYLKINHGEAYKIGITNLSVEERFTKSELAKIEIINITEYEIGAMAKNKESEILTKYKEFKYKGRNLLNSGNTELFYKDVLKLDRSVRNSNN